MKPELFSFQKVALEAVSKHTHVLCISPTGSGKSRIFEELAEYAEARIVIISPLTALARQQQATHEQKGIPSVLGAGSFEHQGRVAKPANKDRVWIISPEMLQYQMPFLERWKPNLVVVDEAHCVFEWGLGFRPSFLEIKTLLKKISGLQSLWLTATFPEKWIKDLNSLVGARVKVLGKFSLPKGLSLQSSMIPEKERWIELQAWMKKHSGQSGIVFCSTRSKCERLSQLLQSESGIPTAFYHAGMSREEREILEKRAQTEKQLILFATTAFGMGMNLLGFSWVLLWQAPLSCLSLAQQVGRVGRLGREAQAKVFWHSSDFYHLEKLVSQSEVGKLELAQTFELLNSPRSLSSGLARYFSAEAIQSIL